MRNICAIFYRDSYKLGETAAQNTLCGLTFEPEEIYKGLHIKYKKKEKRKKNGIIEPLFQVGHLLT